MRARKRTLSAVAAFATTWTLAGCITVVPAAVPGTGKTTPAASAAPLAKKAKPDPAAKPKAGDAGTLDALKTQGRVQVSFKGLGGTARRTLKQTTEDIDRVEVTLLAEDGTASVQALSRAQMMGPIASLFFDRVAVGRGTLAVKAFDVAGKTIGSGEEPVEVVGGKTTEIGMSVKLGASGAVGATIAFEDAEVDASNITGYWYVGGDAPVPDYPVIGCGDGYVWYVTQFGDSVRATVSGYNDGNAADHPNMYWSEEASGSMRDGVVKLHGRVTYTDENGNAAAPPEEADYELKFDAARWQLVGSRNGRPGWATPYYFDPACNGSSPAPFPYHPPSTPAPYPTGSGGPYPYPSGGAYLNPTTVVEGTLYDYAGNPGRGTITLNSWDGNQPFSATVETGPDGAYRIAGVPTGVELELMGTVRNETSLNWQVFYGFDAVEYYDVYTAPESPDGYCVPTTYPTTGADGKEFMYSTCEPQPSCLPTYYPTTGPNGTTLMVQDCQPMYTPGPSWGPGSPPPTWYPMTPPPTMAPWSPQPSPAWSPSPPPTPRAG